MGKNNRYRRAAKARRRREDARRRAQQERYNGQRSVTEMVLAAVHDEHLRKVESRDRMVGRLADRPRPEVGTELQSMLEAQMPLVWKAGWQPVDIVRLANKKLGMDEVAQLTCAIASDASAYENRGPSVAPPWMAQLDDLKARRWWNPTRPWLIQIPGEWAATVLAAIRLLNLLRTVPSIPLLTPPPSEWPLVGSTPIPSHLPSGILSKVRGLLAKAESTTFEAEAQALTAKAQELMTRHRIDRAMVGGEDGSTDSEVEGRRLGVDDPYAAPKASLLAGIADANGCRSVWSKDFGFATVFGYPSELDGVEELFTSLLVQATRALQREGSKQDRYGRSRTTRFRRSFLVAFAARVAARLRETADWTVQAAESEAGAAVLVALDRRARAVDTVVEDSFSGLRGVEMAISDWEGYVSGTHFGDAVDLTTSPARPNTPSPALIGQAGE